MATWSDILSSPEYANTLESIQARLRGQGRAIPQAATEVDTLTQQVGAQQARLQDMGSDLDLAGRKLDLKQGELDMTTRELDRYQGRLLPATLVGMGNIALSGVGAYGNLSATKRSEGRAAAVEQQNKLTNDVLRRMFEQELVRRGKEKALYEPFLQKYAAPASLTGG